MRYTLLAAMLLASVPAAAQVHKCVDAAGKVSYTETPCTAAAKQSQQMMGREATSTYDPYAAQRTMESYDRATAISRSINDGPPGLNPDNGGGIIDNGPNGPGGINRRREAETLQRAQQQIDASRRQAATQEATRTAGPGQLVNCDQAGCWGASNGVRYNFVAGGNLQGTNGQFCARGAGNTYSCN